MAFNSKNDIRTARLDGERSPGQDIYGYTDDERYEAEMLRKKADKWQNHFMNLYEKAYTKADFWDNLSKRSEQRQKLQNDGKQIPVELQSDPEVTEEFDRSRLCDKKTCPICHDPEYKSWEHEILGTLRTKKAAWSDVLDQLEDNHEDNSKCPDCAKS